MNVFKFGGASVKDADAVRNVTEIIRLFEGKKLLIVISAMGKTTNALELVVDALWKRNKSVFDEKIAELKSFHFTIADQLFPSSAHPVYQQLNEVFQALENRYQNEIPDHYNYEYDQIVSLGEVISTLIVEAYISMSGFASKWVDARRLIRTNNVFRDAEVDWKRTEELIRSTVLPAFEQADIIITQGFIGHTVELLTTTLGREGSDFTAGIFAYCLDAENVTIWKDVPGMLNADPKYFDNTIKLDKISFSEAIELSYYGASVIHPKTLKPLQNKNISLFVKSFVAPQAEGTEIQSSGAFDHLVPSFIFKVNQLLISFRTRDFSFIVESHLSDIFNRLSEIGAKINLMQNSALSFSILVDAEKVDIETILKTFRSDYEVRYNEGLELVTIRHYDQATIDRVTIKKDILLEQFSRQTARIVMKDK
ncbi:aspartate kinase [Crocinitomicaceae bacterium CZZ-1]|uniref:Aspartokinase n=1 Tax=Taishania pollutisoli TaxID=2766479 RepID=A0A8J6U1T3_9FLAO|nr:aspartate kinase [Taishania pollutisoli]MBC9811530.1 aspartate kinase [Taishania pollutisoli]MBX2948533.1 aspartate kinase [Crocinitomicaceae bacterium]